MQKEELIPVLDFCSSHNLEISFIYNLEQNGLISTSIIEETTYMTSDQVAQAERIIRLYSELGINIEGIDAIGHLLQKMEEMQYEIIALKNKLGMYEENE